MKRFFCCICCFISLGVFAQADVLTTDKKPLTDPNAVKRKDFLGAISEKINVSRNGKQLLDEKGKVNKDALPIADVKESVEALKKQGKAIKNQLKSNAENLNNGIEGLGLKKNQKVPEKYVKTKFNGREYEGFPVERIVTSFGLRGRETSEEFYVLRQFQEPSKYVKNIYWYDGRGITTSTYKDAENIKILHGPYRKYLGEDLVEEGSYYLGTKDGRWENYFAGDDTFLRDKQYFTKGFLAESEISYYDTKQQKQIKEVVPKSYKKITGDYFMFYETGLVAVEGHLDDSVKVGKWIEYHPFGQGGRRKREILYGKDKFENVEPIVLVEYDNKGKKTYEYKEAKKAN